MSIKRDELERATWDALPRCCRDTSFGRRSVVYYQDRIGCVVSEVLEHMRDDDLMSLLRKYGHPAGITGAFAGAIEAGLKVGITATADGVRYGR